MRLSLVRLWSKPWWWGSVTSSNSTTYSNNPTVNGGTNGVVHLTVELWKSVPINHGGLLKITKSRSVHDVTDNVPARSEEAGEREGGGLDLDL